MGPKTPQIVALGDGGFSMERDGSLLDDYVLSVTDAARPRVCFLPPASRDGRRAGLSANKCGVAEPEQSATAARLRERREAVVREHMQSENEHDFDTTIGTFSHPRYEIIPTGDIFDGEADVRRYFAETRAAFPDQRNELIALHHIDDGVVVEFDLLGTHLGSLRSLAPTGRAFRCRMTAFFMFDDERIVCERVYFDQATILRQLGLAHDPTSVAGRISTLLSHPLTVGRALLRAAVPRGAARG